ncbi:hypothetical protein ANCCAN_21549 [Ancylostoma caninum]|uniref:Uncharacterized protein n=1 Tax=Ancylostoma caninum TaxID=29170 RepID=A0A368FKR3_ANCCA|nr:hypothetical protein ANCCAN_21549 [Ancylostoma caninum]
MLIVWLKTSILGINPEKHMAFADAVKHVKARQKLLDNLLMLTYLKVFCLLGGVSMALILQLWLIHCIILKKQEQPSDEESMDVTSKSRKSPRVKKAKQMPFAKKGKTKCQSQELKSVTAAPPPLFSSSSPLPTLDATPDAGDEKPPFASSPPRKSAPRLEPIQWPKRKKPEPSKSIHGWEWM